MFKQLKIYYVLIALPFALLLTGSTIFFSAIKMTITRNPHPQINYTIFVIILVGGVLVLCGSVVVERDRAFSGSTPDRTVLKKKRCLIL